VVGMVVLGQEVTGQFVLGVELLGTLVRGLEVRGVDEGVAGGPGELVVGDNVVVDDGASGQ